jgi:hypothetical protein
VSVRRCPPNYRPGCSCSVVGLEPSESCPVHGWPDPRQCPYCGAFRSPVRPCKRCGCVYGLTPPNEARPREEVPS